MMFYQLSTLRRQRAGCSIKQNNDSEYSAVLVLANLGSESDNGLNSATNRAADRETNRAAYRDTDRVGIYLPVHHCIL